jgi:hypothetical protein
MHTRLLSYVALAICGVTPVVLYAIVQAFVGASPSPKDELRRLSQLSLSATYSARYGDPNDPNDLITVHQLVSAPGTPVRFRYDFPEPLAHEDIGEPNEDVLKGGDVLIFNHDYPEEGLSCRTERGSCRSIDALELIAFVSLTSLFTYDFPRTLERPHSVRSLPGEVIAGERARCYRIDGVEQSVDEPTGSNESGEGLPRILCYAEDGVPLRLGQASEDGGGFDYVDAVSVSRDVSLDVFEPPFEFVPSVYDRNAD